MFGRLKQQIEELKNNDKINANDKNCILKVAEYLLTREDMDEKYQNEGKNLIDMWEFIKDEARKVATGNSVGIEDEKVYSWAIHYYDESNEQLGINKDSKKTSKKAKKTEEILSKEDENNGLSDTNTEKDEHNDEDIVMVLKGRPITYKEFKEGKLTL